MFAQLENEFDFGEQFALNYAGDPAGTQQAVNHIRETMYAPGPSGLDNNDDLGANSSAFIWEMLGMYPENSGIDTLTLTSPGFPHASIKLANGHTITIDAPGASASRYYVKSLKLNGKRYSKLVRPVLASSTQRLDAATGRSASRPTNWGSAKKDAPPSYTAGTRPVVGFLPVQKVTIAPGASTAVQIGAQNATAKQPDRAGVGCRRPTASRSARPAGRIRVTPNGTRRC